MRVVEALLVLGIAALFLYLMVVQGARALASGLRRRRVARDAARGWRVVKGRRDHLTVVRLEKPYEKPYEIGTVSIMLSVYEYEDKLTTLMLEAQDKADTLNRRLT